MSSPRSKSIDNAPWSGFLLWTFIYTAGGMFTDGYVFGSTSVGIAVAGEDLRLSSVWVGAVTAAVLAGVFVGSLIAGRMADRYGRQRIFFYNLSVFVAACVLQLWATEPATLFAVRFLIGIAIGAEYAIGSSILAEFAPRRKRSFLLSAMTAFWAVGYVVSYLIAFAMRESGIDWTWILASAAVPAFLTLLARLRAPESPRWLVSQGRLDEALATVHTCYGPEYGIDDLAIENDRRVGFSVLFGPQYRTRTAFAAIFWTCQVTVSFAVLLFLPTVLGTLKITSELGVNLLIGLIILAGTFLGIYAVQAINRRPLVIWTFVIMAVSMALMTLAGLPGWVVLALFVVYNIVAAGSGNLQFVYPPELFPTDVRSSGVGFAAAVSRIGSTLSTFALPVMLSNAGANATFLALAGVSALGALISILWAPETRNLSLLESSAVVQSAPVQPVEHAASTLSNDLLT